MRSYIIFQYHFIVVNLRVNKDMGIIRRKLAIHGGLFCGIYTANGKMIGIVDYVPNPFKGGCSRRIFFSYHDCRAFSEKGGRQSRDLRH
jgi:hypothetical protein